jgi:hypothetical protein
VSKAYFAPQGWRRNHLTTLLHTAADGGRPSTIDFLVRECKADIEARDGDGRTPLHVAAKLDRFPVVKVLLRHGADPNAADGISGETPAGLATEGSLSLGAIQDALSTDTFFDIDLGNAGKAMFLAANGEARRPPPPPPPPPSRAAKPIRSDAGPRVQRRQSAFRPPSAALDDMHCNPRASSRPVLVRSKTGRFSFARTTPNLATPAKSSQLFRIVLPDGINAGQAFPVALPGGKKVQVTFPSDRKAGETIQISVLAAS